MAEKIGRLTREFRRTLDNLPGQPLAAGEISLAKNIFGEEIDTSRIKKYFAPLDPREPETLALTLKQNIYFYGPHMHEPDYSQSAPDNYETFVHEITHIWQHQHKAQNLAQFIHALRSEMSPLLRSPRKQYDRYNQYDYKLSENAAFRDFGIEQQAAIIGDYARLFLYPGGYRPLTEYLPSHRKGPLESSLQNAKLLLKTVEERFSQARKTRLTLEAMEPRGLLGRTLLSAHSLEDVGLEMQLDTVALYKIIRDGKYSAAKPLAQKIISLVEKDLPEIRGSLGDDKKKPQSKTPHLRNF